MLAEFMNLGMTVMTPGNAVICFGFLNLPVFQLAILQTFFFITGLEKTAAAAAAIVV